MKIKESDVLERIGEAIDTMDTKQLARLHNEITVDYEKIVPDEIKLCEGWHLIPKEGAH